MENGESGEQQLPPTYEEAFPPLNPTPMAPRHPPPSYSSSSSAKMPKPAATFQSSSSSPSSSSSAVAHSAWPVKSIPSSSVTQVFHVPLVERRFQFDEPLFGSAGESRQSEIIREIMDKTQCDIEITQPKDRSLTIMVSGKPSCVAAARREILTRLQTQAHIDLKIPKEHHKFVIGREGSKLKGIELSSATKISIPRFDDSSDVIRIVGTKEGVDRARHQLQTISDEQAKLAFERLDIEKAYHPFIMGPNNTVLKSISEATGARINMPPISLMKDELTVAGDKDAVAKAVTQIKKIYEDMKRTCSTVSIEVRKSQHKYIIGPRGQGLQEILLNSGVWVEVPSTDSDSNTITLRGPQEKLGHALTQVYEKANSVVCDQVRAPHWLHRFIIGRKGQNVQKITQDLPKVHVEFNSDLDKIILEGPPDQVTQAKEAFETFTEDLMATMDFAEIRIEQKYHRHVIGKGGASVNKIKTETGTSIIIPPDDNKSDVIRIEGDPKGVAAAKSMLLEMAARMENERRKDVLIEQRFHKLIIGSKGEKIREIRDRFNGLQVAFPEAGEKKDIVSLRGASEDVEKCAAHLKKLAVELATSNHREEVRVFKKFHGSIVGRGGATLRKIREDTDTRIELPQENSSSDVITIVGRKENIQKARDMILTIEKDMASVTDETVQIPHRLHNAIIGPKGRLVRSVMEECGGVRIQFPSASESKTDDIKLHGPKEDVAKARAMLLELAGEQALQNHTVEIRCKPEYHRFLIGKNGANIRKVRDQFGARIMFPQKSSDEEPELVTIIGTKEKAEAARQHLQKLIKDLENIVEVEIKVQPKYHRNFVQRRGELIHEISVENGGVIISFPRAGSNSDKVLLKGAKQCIEGAKAHIMAVIEDLEAQVTIECVIEQKHHRTIMGGRGSNVQAITHEHNVSIKFPDRENRSTGGGGDPAHKATPTTEPVLVTTPPIDEDTPPGDGAAKVVNGNGEVVTGGEGEGGGEGEEEEVKPPSPRDIILITGRLENAEAAKLALLELRPVSVEMSIPYGYHRYIIGQKGREISSVMKEHDVNITIPSSDKMSDIITITGPARNCEEAEKALGRRVQQLEAEKEERELRSFTVVMHVEPKHHPNIIGRKGATINRIRDDHDVRIQLPDKDGPNADEITVMGYEHNVKSAENAIQKIVRELEEQISEEVDIDHRVHSRLIGAKGKAISKVMEKFHVDIRFPRDKQSSTVAITGLEENVEDAREHLITLAEDYMQDVIEKAEEEEMKRKYSRPQQSSRSRSGAHNAQGFTVRGGPWSADKEDFPTLGGRGGTGSPPPSSSSSPSSSSAGPPPPTVGGSYGPPKKQWGPSALGPKITRDN